ncbi:MAG: hypothetical protein NTW52_16820 [Planctomycetota bacterium]|nr:hypothetical protein [Planctomycetota bacterium]
MVFKKKKSELDSAADEDKKPSKIAEALQAVRLDPVALVSDVWDTLDMWRDTRHWIPVLKAIPAILITTAVITAVTWGNFTSSSTIVATYIEKAEEVAPIKEDGREKIKTDNKLNQGTSLRDGTTEVAVEKPAAELAAEESKKLEAAQFADLLFRRVLQVESKNKRARYYVANQMSMRGNRDQARSMMESMAPPDAKGYEPAHTWLAGDFLQKLSSGVALDRETLNHHLAIASDWAGTNPGLLAIYSQLLESEKRSREAIGMMQRAANRDPSHYLALASLFARYRQPIQAKEAVERAVQHYSASFGKKDEPDSDRIAVAEAYLQIQKLDDSVKVLQQGLMLRPDRPALRRALSNVYRIAYRMQLRRSESGIQANLNLLNAALAADPTNPLIGEEVALLQPMGVKPDDTLIQTLQKQLAAGNATAVTHVLLGNAYYGRKDLEKAQIHWELALGQDPNFVLAMNNLAMGLALKEKPNFDRAMELVDRALVISKDNPEVLDSKGEILALMSKHLEAIPFFENAISLGPYRMLTREKLARSYEAAGLPGQSQAQWEVIEKLKAQIKKNQEEAAKMQAAQQEAAATIAAEAEAAAAKAATQPAEFGTENAQQNPSKTAEENAEENASKVKTD